MYPDAAAHARDRSDDQQRHYECGKRDRDSQHDLVVAAPIATVAVAITHQRTTSVVNVIFNNGMVDFVNTEQQEGVAADPWPAPPGGDRAPGTARGDRTRGGGAGVLLRSCRDEGVSLDLEQLYPFSCTAENGGCSVAKESAC